MSDAGEYSNQRQLPPAKFVFDDNDRRGEAIDSMVSGGCIISGSTVHRSVLFSSIVVHSYSLIEHSVILTEVGIGRYCKIRYAVIDRGCKIEPGAEIGLDAMEDARRFHVTPKGVVLATPERLGRTIAARRL